MAKPVIKIFVSHRRDLNSAIIDNPLYYHVVSGTELGGFTDGKWGDNTGDNISAKNPYYSELAVQYWAWKNQEADYYGLCHYRRYLSFADKTFPEWNEQRFVLEHKLTKSSVKKYDLLNVNHMRQEIMSFDLITSVEYPVKDIPNAVPFRNVYEAFVLSPALFTSAKSVETIKTLVKKKFPQYYATLLKVLDSPLHRGFNCYVMRKNLFFAMCEFEFGILFELEKQLDLEKRVGNSKRELGYLSEILYDTFIQWVIDQGTYRVKERQIVFFADTAQASNLESGKKSKFTQWLDKLRTKLIPNRRRLQVLEKDLRGLLFQQSQQLAAVQGQIKALENTLNIRLDTLRTLSMAANYRTEAEIPAQEAWKRFWSGFAPATGKLRLLQQAEMVLLENLQLICRKLNIRFWAHGGTLVGAIRHRGFVPWDDDVDLAMTRADFNKLRKFLEEKSTRYTIENSYYLQIGAREYRFRRADLPHSVFIDIFVYDPYELRFENKTIDWKDMCNQKKRLIAQLMAACGELKAYPREPLLKGFDELKAVADQLFDVYIAHNAVDHKAPYLLWGLDNNYENETSFAWHYGRIFKYEDIFPLKEAKFGKLTIHIPANFEEYVYTEYGVSAWDVPNNMGSSIHVAEFFSHPDCDKEARQLLEEGIVQE